MRASARRQAAIASSRSIARAGLLSRRPSHGPGVELEGAVPPRGEGGVQHVQRVERLDALHEEVLREAVQRAAREPAGVDGPALLEERAELLVDLHVPRE